MLRQNLIIWILLCHFSNAQYCLCRGKNIISGVILSLLCNLEQASTSNSELSFARAATPINLMTGISAHPGVFGFQVIYYIYWLGSSTDLISPEQWPLNYNYSKWHQFYSVPSGSLRWSVLLHIFFSFYMHRPKLWVLGSPRIKWWVEVQVGKRTE